MKTIRLVLCLLMLSCINAFSADTLLTTRKKFCVATNALQLPTWFSKKNSRVDFNFRYSPIKHVFINSHLGYNIRTKGSDTNIVRKYEGYYYKIGLGLETYTANENINMFFAYNFCGTKMNSVTSVHISNDFWGDDTKLVLDNQHQMITYHELYSGIAINFFKNKKVCLYIEPALKFRLGVQPQHKISNEMFISGFGQYDTELRNELAISHNIGIRF